MSEIVTRDQAQSWMGHAIESAARRQKFNVTERTRLQREIRRTDAAIKRYESTLAEMKRDRARLFAELVALEREARP